MCGSEIVKLEIFSNNDPILEGTKVTGFRAGSPSLRAECLNDCLIRIQASYSNGRMKAVK